MGVRNNLLGGTDMGSEQARSVDWNDTFNAMYFKAFKLIATDTTADSGSTKTVSIPANAVTETIIVIAEVRGGFNTGSGSGSNIITFNAGLSGATSLVRSRNFLTRTADADTDLQFSSFGTQQFVYTPSAGEKSTGFDIELIPSTTGSGHTGTVIGEIYIFGN